MSNEQRIKREAERLGFASIGFAVAGRSRTHARYAEWLDEGCGAEMGYLHRRIAARADVRAVLPGARTVVCVAARYLPNPDPDRGFSGCAAAQDYHRALKRGLKALGKFLREECGAGSTRACVDTAPVLEREWALRTGIGWRGRQGQVINERLGACLYLGELLTDLPLAPTSPLANRCGLCRRCLDACPTGALRGNGTVRSERCRAYLTIEHPGPIPEALRPLVGEALFGCDGCTAVCPWNARATGTVWKGFLPHARPSAEVLLNMTPDAFDATFSDTAVQRSGLERLQRNAAVVLGNRGGAAAAAALRKARRNAGSELVRQHVRWALRRLRAPGKTGLPPQPDNGRVWMGQERCRR